MECINFKICNQYKMNKIIKYCNDCFLYFDSVIILELNVKKNQCPICLENNENIETYKLKQCDHIICKTCLFNIYFDKSYLINIPINPISYLSKKWKYYINSTRSRRIKFNIINKYINRIEYTLDDINNDLKNLNLNIPSIFKIEIIQLINYQIQFQRFINKHNYQKENKIKYINKCSYCRKIKIDNIEI